MKKLTIATALMAFPMVTFAGGAGNMDLLKYTQGGNPSVITESEVSEPTVVEPTRSYYQPTQSFIDSPSVNETDTFNSRDYYSDRDLVQDRNDAARKKLLRYRSLGY